MNTKKVVLIESIDLIGGAVISCFDDDDSCYGGQLLSMLGLRICLCGNQQGLDPLIRLKL